MRMYGGLLLVEEQAYQERMKGSIILPDNSDIRKQFSRGKVISIGPGIRHACSTIEYAKIQVQVGDIILFEKERGIPVLVRGEEMLIVGEPAIVAVYEPEDLIEGETNVRGN